MTTALNTNEEGIIINTEVGFEGMRKAGQLAARTLDMITEHVQPGVTTDELDKLCFDFITKISSGDKETLPSSSSGGSNGK